MEALQCYLGYHFSWYTKIACLWAMIRMTHVDLAGQAQADPIVLPCILRKLQGRVNYIANRTETPYRPCTH